MYNMFMNKYVDVYLFRHGEALNNIESHLIGGRGENKPLVDRGVVQAKKLGEVLRLTGLKPDTVCSSPALRARQTGEIALDAMGISLPIQLDERLHEQDTGDWTGCVAADIFTDEMVRIIEEQGKDFRSPGGESMSDVGRRMQEWAESLKSGTADKPNTVFAFTSGGSIRCFASQLFDWSHARTYQTRPDNTSVSIFKKNSHERWRMEALGINATELEKR